MVEILDLLEHPIYPDVTFENLMPSDHMLLSTIGYASMKDVPREVYDLLSEVERQLNDVGKPQIAFEIYPGRVLDEERIDVAGKILTPGKKITDGYQSSQYFSVVIGSIGKDANRWLQSDALNADLMSGFIADNLCTLIAERMVFWTQKYVADLVRPFSLKVTASYSPGYCDWALTDQKNLFAMMPEGICGVELCSDSLLMLPIKSVSTIIGIGEDVSVKRSGCALCNKTDCYRRKCR